MNVITKILDFYLILLFSEVQSEFQDIFDKIYVSKPSLKHSSSHESRRSLSFNHNDVKNMTEMKTEGLGTHDVLNLSSNIGLIAASPNYLPHQASPQKFPKANEATHYLREEQSRQEAANATAPAEQHEKGTQFLPSELRMTPGCGILQNGLLDLSYRNLSEHELSEKMNSGHCKTTLDKTTEVDISHNHLEMNLTILIPLLLKMENLHSIDASYNKITREVVNKDEACDLKQGSLLFLNLSHNPLRTLENLCLPSSLTSIDLSFTGISQIPKQFALRFLHIAQVSVQGNSLIFHGKTFLGHARRSKMLPPRISYIDNQNETPIRSLPTNVKRLIMSNCSIVELPEWFSTNLTKLLFLDLSGNPMHSFPRLPNSLHRLDLSNAFFQKMDGLQHCSNLSQFKIANNKMHRLLGKDLPLSLKELDISNNKLHKLPCLGMLQKLESLNASSNLITKLKFNRSSSLISLDLSRNIITSLPDKMAMVLSELKYLNLSGNKISFLQPGCLPTSLLELDISDNAITIIMKKTFQPLGNLEVLTVHGTHFFCNCDLYWFANTYLYSPHLQINGRENIFCSFPPRKRGLSVQDSNLTMLYCSLSLQMGITVCTVVLIMSILTVLCWRFHVPWYIRMGWYWCTAKRKQYEKRPEHKLYDVFISYSETDGPWTKGTLLEKLEANGFKVCYHERDFRPGHPVLGNIFYCIENSHKVLFVLSPSFVNSCWCQYELYFAEHRVLNENQDTLIMVVLDDLPLNSIPQKFSKLRKLMKRKTYLKWSPEEPRQKVFWGQLTAVLRTVNEPLVVTEGNGTH